MNNLAIYCERIDDNGATDDDDDDGSSQQTNTFHPNCFRCYYCDEQLAYNIYCSRNNRPYCERHYMDSLLPRCSYCDEVCVCVCVDLFFFFASLFLTTAIDGVIVVSKIVIKKKFFFFHLVEFDIYFYDKLARSFFGVQQTETETNNID